MLTTKMKITKVGEIPIDWETATLSEVADVRDGTHESPKYYKNGVPFITSKNLKPKGINFSDIKFISEEDHQNFQKRSKVDDGDILFGMIGTIGNPVIVNKEFEFSIKNVALIKFNNGLLYNKYLKYLLDSDYIKKQFQKISDGGVQKFIGLGTIRKLEIPLPSIREQYTLAEILISVENTISKTEDIIKQTEKVKKGLMQQFLTKGIGHTKFKQTDIGEIPEEWEVVCLGEVFDLVKRPLRMGDEEQYQLVTVKRRHGGVVPRKFLKGKEIAVKSQFYIDEGDFLISKRQIVHGACEVVPKSMHGAIVSNEYHTLRTKESLCMDYLRWYSRSAIMMNYFFISSIGVHIEKMLFKIEDWFKRKIPLPPVSEQIKIANTLNSIEQSLEVNRTYLNRLQSIKRGLMQVLLTGKVRVKVNEQEVR